MKKRLAITASALLLSVIVLLIGCAQTQTDVTREEIVAAYEDAGYFVTSKIYDKKLDHGQIGYIHAEHPDGDYIFSIFEFEADAKAYKKEFYHPAMMGLFSVIFGDPSWQRWEVYGCFVAEYDEPDFLDPFEELLKSN